MALEQRPHTLYQTWTQNSPLLIQPKSQQQKTRTNVIAIESKLQQKNLKLYMNRDEKYQQVLNRQHKQHLELAQVKKQEIEAAHTERRQRSTNKSFLVFGKGYDGYGNGKTDGSTRIVYPKDKKHKRHHLIMRLPYQALMEQSKKEEMLVPIRLDIENEGYKVRDTFTWNMNENFITPEQFADITCEDLRLPVAIFSPLIAASIKEQVQDFFVNAPHPKDKPELRMVIKLDITVGNRVLNDQFEWDINCPKNSPESFAHTMATDLGLGGEFKTAIAHSIREQISVYIKSLLISGYEFDSPVIENDELRRSFLPTVHKVHRENNAIEKFTPSIIELSDVEIARIEKVRTRESRRKRRGVRNRKGGVLPDREPIPTFRTILAQLPEQEMTDEQFLKSIQSNSDTPNNNQRKSAVKARMNIAAEAAGITLTSGQFINSNSNNTDQVTRPMPSRMVGPSWRCADCQCSPFMTTIIRSGPTGERSLCNACGLYRFKFNAVRPQNYMDKEIKNDIPHLNNWQN